MSASFEPPEWMGSPVAGTRFDVRQDGDKTVSETLKLDGKAYYTFGRNEDICDVTVSHSSVSRLHCAVVHHQNGRLYVIDLQTRHGTYVNGKKIDKYKPTQLTTGAKVKLGENPRTYVAVGCSDKGGGAGESSKRSHHTEEGPPAKRAKEGKGETVRCLHLLVKHAGSRRPASWKDDNITRTLQEAEAVLAAHREAIVNEAEATGHLEKAFNDLAAKESDCSSAKRGGDLGPFEHGKMQKPFADAAFALKVGELSEMVTSDSGVHIILRLE